MERREKVEKMAPRAIDLNARSNYGGPEVETHDFALEMIFAEVPCVRPRVRVPSVRPAGAVGPRLRAQGRKGT